jgi:glycosyltransferase involved in cell wall biosynthesis
MFDSQPRRIGVGMMSVRTSANAGVSRYALAIVEGLAIAAPSVRFECYVRPEFEPPSTWNSLPNLRLHRVRMYKAVRFGAGWRPPIVGYHAWFAPAYDLLRLTPIRQVAMVHDVFPLTNPEWFADDAVASIARGVREAALVSGPVLVNSEFTGRTLRELFRIGEDRVVVTPLGPGNEVALLDRESVKDEAVRQLGVPFRRFFLSVGTLEPRKNLLSLFEAFARISGEPGHDDVGLVVVGARGWKDQDAIARLGAPDLKNRVAWLGYLADDSLAVLFARCEAYVCPSLSEGFGMPVLEAMRAGAPVLSSSSGALPEVGGSACRYFDPLDILSLSSLLTQTLETPAQRAEWSALGRKQAARFSWRQTVSRTLEALVGPTPWALGKPHGPLDRSRPIHSGSSLRDWK